MQDKLFEQLNIKKEPLKVDSQCKYGLVAQGFASAYMRWPVSASYQEKIWVVLHFLKDYIIDNFHV